MLIAALITWFAIGSGGEPDPMQPRSDGVTSLRLIPGQDDDASTAQYGAPPAITVLPGN